MASPSISSPSEGEIVESDSEKATTTLVSNKGTSVDGHFRKRVSVSRSPSPIRSPGCQRSRSESRSPYRESRGVKRLVEDDHYDRSRNDPRRFKVRYEDRPYGGKLGTRDSFRERSRTRGADRSRRHEDRGANGRARDKRQRTRSRSPPQFKSYKSDRAQYEGTIQGPRSRRDQGDQGYDESWSKLSKEQSVSDRGQHPVAAAQPRREAEIKKNQKQDCDSFAKRSAQTAKYVPSSLRLRIADFNDSDVKVDEVVTEPDKQVAEMQAVDEATLIEERRKRREAIKARHRGQATPLLVQALVLDNESGPSTPKQTATENRPQNQGILYELYIWILADF